MNPNKRRDASPAATPAKRPRKACSYGDNCYRRNPAHLREFSHPHLESILDNYTGAGEYPIPEDLVMQKQMIEEQIQIMLEKNIYTPGNKTTSNSVASVDATGSINLKNSSDDTSTTQNNTPKNMDSKTDSQPNKLKNVPKNTGLTSKNSETKSEDNLSKTTDNIPSQKDSFRVKTDVKTRVEHSSVETEKSNFSRDLLVQSNRTASGSSKADSDYRPMERPTKRIEEFFKVVLPAGRTLEKYRRAGPYHIFYTAITAARETHAQPNSITFQELLDPSLGELKCSLQINFMVDIGWLLAHYYFAGYRHKRLTILYGAEMPDIATIGEKNKNIDTHMVNMGTPFGKHHTKMMILCYEDGSLRVVVSTANLYSDDWENRSQGLWLSPPCPELPDSAMPHEGDSATGFKKTLLSYLEHYRLPCLASYVQRVKRCDFSMVDVFLVASVPGAHTDASWGMSRVGALLAQHCRIPARDKHKWDLIAQASSIGSYGKQPSLWLTGDFQNKFCRVQSESALLSSTPAKLKLIYPSLENVQQSHDGLLGGGGLPYTAAIHSKQPWLNAFFHQWKALGSGRDRAMPHIKSYLRASPDYKMAAYYLLTSANVSKAAWGTINKGNGALRIMSYEAGVLFLPRFVINKDFFPLDKNEEDSLPLVYDLPPKPYTDAMGPWVMDYVY